MLRRLTVSFPVPKTLRQSASVVLAAQVPGSEFDYKVLLLKRHNTKNFDQTFAFPGGNLDPEDASSPRWFQPLGSYPPHTFSDSTLPYRIGALRELYEECGLLFAHHHTSGTDTRPPSDSPSDWAGPHQLVHPGSAVDSKVAKDFVKHCTTQQCYPLVQALLPMARWITPIHYPRRFDTHFFLLPYSAYTTVSGYDSSSIELLSNQTTLPPVEINTNESSEYRWLTPAEALTQYQDQRLHLFPPQWYLLNDMARFHRLTDLVAYTKVQPLVPFLPKFTKLPNQQTISVLPGDNMHPYSAYGTIPRRTPEFSEGSLPPATQVHWTESFSVEMLRSQSSEPYHRLLFEMVDGKMLNLRLKKDLRFSSVGD